MSTNPGRELRSQGTNFTPTIRHDTYDFIKPEKQNLSGKNVLITGASKGIGRATALAFARTGVAGLILAARSDLSSLGKDVLQAAQKAGRQLPKVHCIKLDVTSRESTEEAAKDVEKVFGHVDVIIHIAGLLETFRKIIDQDPDEWWKVWETNTKGAFLVMRSFLPLVIKSPNENKTVISLSSIGAHVIMPGLSAYQPGKLALLRFMEFVNVEYGDQGILAFAIHPGAVPTEMGVAMGEDFQQYMIDTPELAADTLTWLAGERRAWLAGRFVSCTWDMQELLQKRAEIEKGDLLKVRMAVETFPS